MCVHLSEKMYPIQIQPFETVHIFILMKQPANSNESLIWAIYVNWGLILTSKSTAMSLQLPTAKEQLLVIMLVKKLIGLHLANCSIRKSNVMRAPDLVSLTV